MVSLSFPRESSNVQEVCERRYLFFVASSKLLAQLYPRLPRKKPMASRNSLGLGGPSRLCCSSGTGMCILMHRTIVFHRSTLRSVSQKLWKADPIDFHNLPDPNSILTSVADDPVQTHHEICIIFSLSLSHYLSLCRDDTRSYIFLFIYIFFCFAFI